MPAPEFSLEVSGSNPKSTTVAALTTGVNAVAQALFDQIGAIATGLEPAGNWSAASGSFPSGSTKGTYYVVSAAGTVGGQAFAIGDWLVPLKDGASTATYAGNWFRADYSKVVPRRYADALELKASQEPPRPVGSVVQYGPYEAKVVATDGEAHLKVVDGWPMPLKVLPLFGGDYGGVNHVAAFGAKGDGVADDTAAIQKAIDTGAAHLIYTGGTYLVNGLLLRSFQTHQGRNGGARINTSGTAFTWTATTQYVEFCGLDFGGTGKAIFSNDPSFYLQKLTVRDCQFGNTLSECVYGTLLFPHIENNLFGANFGTPAANHRHVYIKGTTAGGLANNVVSFARNRFFRSAGAGLSAVYMEFGSGATFYKDTFEECGSTPVYLDRMGRVTFEECWFEGNTTATQIISRNTVVGANYYKTKISLLNNDFLLLNPANTSVVDMDTNSKLVQFKGNNCLTTATPAVSTQSGILNNGVTGYGENAFDGSWNVAKANKVTNGDATNGTTGWTPVWATLSAVTGGGPDGGNYFELTRTTNNDQRMEQVVTGLEFNKTYRAEYYVRSGSSGNEAFKIEAVAGVTRVSTGTSTAGWVKHTIEFLCLDTYAIFRLYKNTATAGTMHFGGIRIEEVIK